MPVPSGPIQSALKAWLDLLGLSPEPQNSKRRQLQQAVQDDLANGGYRGNYSGPSVEFDARFIGPLERQPDVYDEFTNSFFDPYEREKYGQDDPWSNNPDVSLAKYKAGISPFNNQAMSGGSDYWPIGAYGGSAHVNYNQGTSNQRYDTTMKNYNQGVSLRNYEKYGQASNDPIPTGSYKGGPAVRYIPPIAKGGVQDTIGKMQPAPARGYTVKPGDTLSSIAKQTYGSPSLWRQFLAKNPELAANPDLIRPGQVISI